MGQVWIDDTTLRDGEQTAGVVFANSEKVRLAQLLTEIGVPQIEVGIPAMGGDELEAIKEIVALDLPTSILAWNRAVISDLEASISTGVQAVAVSISASDIHIEHKLRRDRAWVLESIKRSVDFAKSRGLYVSLNAEDASRAEMEFLLEFALAGKEYGADRLRFCDTLGILDPFQSYERVKTIIEQTGLAVEMHTHDDFGLATANALAGVRAGAAYVNVTVNGLGERAGNAALEEVVMALKCIMGQDLGIHTSRLRELSEYVARAAGRPLSVSKAIVGDNVFAHESGIHADGVLKDPRNYEAFAPESVGMTRQLVIGKHSGSTMVKFKFQEFGITLSDEAADQILARVRRMAVQVKRSLFDKELMYIYQDYQRGNGQHA
ncbi:MAG: homocitrate synthase [Bacillota bacterium]|nr:homocitrate synthase [Bacillota bacterium]